jgi:hypothetical protein
VCQDTKRPVETEENVNLYRVTITGADDATDISKLVELTLEFPFVEWGILVSNKHQGRRRFPSTAWISRFLKKVVDDPVNAKISTHLCGEYVREFLLGQLSWTGVPEVFLKSQRIQINTHGELYMSTAHMWRSMATVSSKEFIFQLDTINDHLLYAGAGGKFKVSGLFDRSHGAGLLPDYWPSPLNGIVCGYAGGLGPHNVADQLPKIAQACANKSFWIDMETQVRTHDDASLDLDKVRTVLKTCAPMMSLTMVGA